MPRPPFTLDPDDERRLAATLFNHTWTLLEKGDRSVADDDEMIHSAHASRAHWGVVGTPVNFARGEWQVSRVYFGARPFRAGPLPRQPVPDPDR